MSTSYPLHKIRVALLENIHPEAARAFDDAGYSVETYPKALAGDELMKLAEEVHIIGIRSKTQLRRDFFEAAKRCWAVGCFCIGTNQVDLDSAAETGTVVFNAPFSNTRSVAEKTIAEIIGLARKAFDRNTQMHKGEWHKSAVGCHEVRGMTLGIVGYGRIGSQLSVLAEALGLRVVYFDIVDRLPMGNAKATRTLEELLETADVVSLHVPATPETKMMMGAEQMARMKKGAFLINNARGSVVDISALAAAIRSEHLGGAAIDVFPKEPQKNDDTFESELCGLPNVILSPHVGGSTVEAQYNIAVEVSGKLAKYMNNGSTTTAVNFPEVELPQLHDDHHRILHYHHNVPGVLSKLQALIASSGANVASQFLQSNPKYGYVISDVSKEHGEDLKRQLADVPETIRVRTLW